jgi:thioredoxin 1
MRNQFFVLEQMATKGLLLQLARGEMTQNGDEATTRTERQLIGDYLQEVASKAAVSDQDVDAFYEQNKAMCGGATLEQVKDGLKEYVLQQKQEEAVTEHIRTLGRRVPIRISSSWVKEQSVPAMDNAVDKARQSGRPSLVDFGSVGCGPCDMMAPILETLAEKYEGKANVEFVHVGEEEILAARFGIQTIPVQVFFDKNGKEVYRHTGFFPQDEIEKKLAGMGVQ